MPRRLAFILLLVFFVVFIILIGGVFFYVKKMKKNPSTICNHVLTDDEFITHMIDHHQVAVDMSEIHLHTTKNPVMADILRNLLTLQTYEINLMKDSRIIDHSNDELNDEMSDQHMKMDNSYRYTQGDFAKPNTPFISNTFCDPEFFNMSKHKKLHKMTDAMYIAHMIPHHQVAVDMSKIILQNTNNDFIIDLANRIIINQQAEINKLDSLTKSKSMFESNILQ